VLHPNFVPWQPLVALALHRLGRTDEAREQISEAVGTARRFRAPRAEGIALRVTGLIEGSVDTLAEAVAVLEPTPARLEHARALLDLGAALRRANHRTDARQPLEQGRSMATACGATALATTARIELAAAGVRVRGPAVTGVDALTPAERRIADLAAAGSSNREIAQTLFITPKTVENHLGGAYRKLSVAGRVELGQVLHPPR
jgi:DNA-binding CsgD family transcriptional regulator